MIDINYMIAGALTGLVVGLTGVGGGALMTPILLLIFGVAPTTAIATDLWFAAISKLAAAWIHHRSDQINWVVANRLWSGSLPMGILTAIAVSLGAHFHKIDWLAKVIGIMIFVTATGLLLAPYFSRLGQKRRLNVPLKFKSSQLFLTVVAGSMLGICVTLTSIGAGALGSVILLYLYPFRMTPHRLVATDIVHAIPLAMVAGTGYLIAGMVDWRMLSSLLAGSIPAVISISLLTHKVSARWIQISLSAVLMMVATKIVITL